METVTRIEKDQIMGTATLAGVALALHYLNKYEGMEFSLQDLNFHAAEYCNHRKKNSGKNLQSKCLEWKYISQPGFPYFLTGTLSNITMAKARVERFAEAIKILKLKKADSVLMQAMLDQKEFIKNNPKLEKYKVTNNNQMGKTYEDGTDIFQILEAIAVWPSLFILNESLDDLYSFISGYKLLALETKAEIKNLEKFEQFSCFLRQELEEDCENTMSSYKQLQTRFGSEEGYIKFFVYLERYKKLYGY